MQKIIDSLEYEYKVIDDEVCIRKIKGSTEHVKVPDYIDGVKVTELSSLVFQVDNLKSITLPKYFKKYDVEKTFSNSDYCDKLEAINISDTIYSNYSSIDGVLYYKGDDYKLGLVSYPNNKKDSILYVPQNANWISVYAFNSGCNNLEKIVISSVLKHFEGNEFNVLTNLNEFIVDELNNLIMSIDGVLFTKYPMELNRYPAKKTEKTYKIPVGTESISFYAFYKQSFLEFVSIPNSVKKIEFYAFFKAESLKYVYLEKQSNLQKIGKNAFKGALQLQYINIPESVREIDDNAFLTNPKKKLSIYLEAPHNIFNELNKKREEIMRFIKDLSAYRWYYSNCEVIFGDNHEFIQEYLNASAEMDCSDKSINDLIGKRMFKNAIICLTKIMEKGEFITTYLFKLIKVLNLDKNFAMAQDALFNFAIYITNKSKLLLNKNSEGVNINSKLSHLFKVKLSHPFNYLATL